MSIVTRFKGLFTASLKPEQSCPPPADFFNKEMLLNSGYMERLSVLAHQCPSIDSNNLDQVKTELAESLYFLINALDNNKVSFDTDLERAAFYQILFVSFQLVTQINPNSNTRH